MSTYTVEDYPIQLPATNELIDQERDQTLGQLRAVNVAIAEGKENGVDVDSLIDVANKLTVIYAQLAEASLPVNFTQMQVTKSKAPLTVVGGENDFNAAAPVGK